MNRHDAKPAKFREPDVRVDALARRVLDAAGRTVGQARLDLLVGGELVGELKAVEQLAPIHLARVLSYLKATGHGLGLLIGFNVDELRRGTRRVVLSRGVLGGVAVRSPGMFEDRAR